MGRLSRTGELVGLSDMLLAVFEIDPCTSLLSLCIKICVLSKYFMKVERSGMPVNIRKSPKKKKTEVCLLDLAEIIDHEESSA